MRILKPSIVPWIFLLFFAFSCQKYSWDESKLPPETKEGRNTFGCLVNGQVWLPQGVPFSIPALLTYASNSRLSISAQQGPSLGIGFVLSDIIIKADSTYILKLDDNIKGGYIGSCSDGSSCVYDISSKYSGELSITRFDTINKIVSGTFNFKAQLTDSLNICGTCDTAIINITEGRFDLKYDEYEIP